jgi:hypothetical protein
VADYGKAQQPERMRRIGVFLYLAEGDQEGQRNIDALRNGLREFSETCSHQNSERS